MSANKEIVRVMQHAWNRRDWSTYEAQFADSIRWSKFPYERNGLSVGLTRAVYVISDISESNGGAPPNHCMQPTPSQSPICIRKFVACLARG